MNIAAIPEHRCFNYKNYGLGAGAAKWDDAARGTVRNPMLPPRLLDKISFSFRVAHRHTFYSSFIYSFSRKNWAHPDGNKGLEELKIKHKHEGYTLLARATPNEETTYCVTRVSLILSIRYDEWAKFESFTYWVSQKYWHIFSIALVKEMCVYFSLIW